MEPISNDTTWDTGVDHVLLNNLANLSPVIPMEWAECRIQAAHLTQNFSSRGQTSPFNLKKHLEGRSERGWAFGG